MNRIFVFAVLLFAASASAQEAFQGTIVYQMQSEKKKDEGELTVSFAPKRITVKFREKKNYDKTYLLLLLD